MIPEYRRVYGLTFNFRPYFLLGMKLSRLFLGIFPVIVVAFALLVGYCQLQVEKSVDTVRTFHTTRPPEDYPSFTLGNNHTIFDVYGSAETMMRESSALFDSDGQNWYVQHNSKDMSIKSRAVDGGLLLHRTNIVLESRLNISKVFQALTSEAFLPSLYPVSSFFFVSLGIV